MARNRWNPNAGRSGQYVTKEPGGREIKGMGRGFGRGGKRGSRGKGRGILESRRNQSSGGGGNKGRDRGAYDAHKYGKGIFNDLDIEGLRSEGVGSRGLRKIYENQPGYKVTQKGQVAMGDYKRAGAYKTINDFDPDDIENRWQRAASRGDELTAKQQRNVEKYDTDIGAKEISVMKNEHGWGAKEINDAIKRNNWTLSNKAQNRLNSWLTNLGSKNPTDVTDPKDGTPVMDTKPIPGAGGSGGVVDAPKPGKNNDNFGDFDSIMPDTSIAQEQSVNNNRMNNNRFDNRIGDGNKIYGNVNQGQIDNSLTFANQTAGGGPNDMPSMVDNFQVAAAGMALNDWMMNKSRYELDGGTRAAKATGQAEDLTNFYQRDMYDEQNTRKDPQNWADQARVEELKWAGDLAGMEPPEWHQPKAPKKEKSDLLDYASDLSFA